MKMEELLAWHNQILDTHYEMERLSAIAHENEKQDLLRQKWELEDRLRIAERFIPLNRINEYMGEAYGRKN